MYKLINTTLKKERRTKINKLLRLNILLVEDSPLNTKLVSILFLQNGLKLEVAGNGAEAIEKIRTGAFDIVLMDMEMPVMNGYEATAVIRQQLKNNVPIIAMTAHAMAGEREKCLQAGMNDHISKPVDAELLFASIYDLTCNKKNIRKKAVIPGLTRLPSIPVKVCNLGYLLDITRGNKITIRKVMTVFLEETPKELSALTNAIKKVNYSIISNISHKIRSSFSILGISVLEPVLAEMEQLGTLASGIEKIKQLNRRINMVFKQAKEEMKLMT